MWVSGAIAPHDAVTFSQISYAPPRVESIAMRSVFAVVGLAGVLASSACGFSATTGAVDGDSGVNPGSVTVGFLAATSLEDERSGTISVPVHLSAPATTPISVSYTFADGSATRPMDFAGAEGALTFAPGETDQVIQLMINDDGVDETANETFDIVLASPTGGAALGRARHTVTISANILPRVSFALVTSMKPESMQETFVATLDVASAAPVSVDYALAGTASSADYALTAGTINFPAGTQSQSFTLDPIDDALDEDNETLRVTLVSSVNAAIASSAATRTHTLEDNDPLPIVSFMGSTRTVGEDTTSVTLTVNLNTASGRQVTVPFAMGGATATADTDFSYDSTAALVFPPGTTSRTITITIVDDGMDENDETITTVLGTPQNATLGASSFTVTITDDDNPPSVRWNTAGRAASEGDQDTTYDYELVLSAASGKQITVPVAITGDAEAGDFSAPASVTFMPGQMMKNFRLTIVGDNLNNPEDANTETVTMTLTNTGLVNAVQGSPNQVTHTIQDDD